MSLFASCGPWKSVHTSCTSSLTGSTPVPSSSPKDASSSPSGARRSEKEHPSSFKKEYKSLKVASKLVGASEFEWTSIGKVVGEKDNPEQDFDAVELLPGQLWVGSAQAALDNDGLKKNNIRFILTIASHLILTTEKSSKKQSFLIDHAVLEVQDREDVDLLSHFDEVLEWMDHAIKRGAVLVHCAQGVSRSVTICLAYLMSRNKMTYADAVAYVESKRPGADPNFGFRSQLLKYEAFGFNGAKAAKSKINYLSIT